MFSMGVNMLKVVRSAFVRFTLVGNVHYHNGRQHR